MIEKMKSGRHSGYPIDGLAHPQRQSSSQLACQGCYMLQGCPGAEQEVLVGSAVCAVDSCEGGSHISLSVGP
jgi:hypothetical protein